MEERAGGMEVVLVARGVRRELHPGMGHSSSVGGGHRG